MLFVAPSDLTDGVGELGKFVASQSCCCPHEAGTVTCTMHASIFQSRVCFCPSPHPPISPTTSFLLLFTIPAWQVSVESSLSFSSSSPPSHHHHHPEQRSSLIIFTLSSLSSLTTLTTHDHPTWALLPTSASSPSPLIAIA